MPTKPTLNQILDKFINIHGNFYDYSKFIYKNIDKKGIVICPLHGEFEITPTKHIDRKQGCPDCGILKCAKSRTSNKEEFIKKSIKRHGDKFDLTHFNYVKSDIPGLIICKICKSEFYKSPNHHLNVGCKICAGQGGYTVNTLIAKFKSIHGDNHYDYSTINEENYVDTQHKVPITCKIHNYQFLILVNNHLNGRGCKYCGFERSAKAKHLSHEEFLEKIKQIHGDDFEILGKYIPRKSGKIKRPKIKVKHNLCGKVSNISIVGLLTDCGCPFCNETIGSRKVRMFLEKQNLIFEKEYRFKDCKDKKPLPFDFAVFNTDNSLKCLIEFDGPHHFEPINFSSGTISFQEVFKNFELMKEHDKIKNEYCKNNNIKLIRIHYKDIKFIEIILFKELFSSEKHP